ncbi:MAG: NAD(P)-dependent alcohol dehydrogenase [Deltaproteobacteria bacterium]|nr:NAD(P)-dependent alcohol dehydrogenase [Deltaproteobacteria bacterium]
MKAMVQRRYGEPEVLELREIDRPSIRDDQVLVRVRAASINPGDWATLRGEPFVARLASGLLAPRNPVGGMDLAGTVEAVGKNVTRLRPGDEVFGQGNGTFAEYAPALEKNLVHKPAGVTFEQAAAVPVAGMTALQAIRDVGAVKAGQQVLITGAGGGIGTFAVQIAKALGAQVTGVCSTAKVELVRSLGADRVIDYTREDFTRGGLRYDVILDNAGKRTLAEARRALAARGTLIPNNGQFEHRWLASLPTVLWASLLSLVVTQRLRPLLSLPDTARLLALKDLLESGKVRPVVGKTYPLSDAGRAFAEFGQGHALGKLVLTV